MASLDRYNRWARLAPAFIVLLPLGLAAAAWAPAGTSLLGTIGSVGGAAALSMLLAQIVRDAGKRKEPGLFERWGGMPTTRQLSFRHTTLNHHSLAAYHERLRHLRPDLPVPSTEEAELQDLRGAETAYESLADFLREATRDTSSFRLVHEELIAYGFRRNLWAIKPLGLFTSFVATALCVLRLYQLDWAVVPNIGAAMNNGMCLGLLIVWAAIVTPDWVRTSAFEYANRLIAAAGQL